MKIIKPGKILVKKEIVYVTVCRKCTAELEYTQDDIKFEEEDDCCTGRSMSMPYITCPCCGNVFRHFSDTKTK